MGRLRPEGWDKSEDLPMPQAWSHANISMPTTEQTKTYGEMGSICGQAIFRP